MHAPHVLEHFFVFVTPEGFTIMVANQDLEKARAYLNQVPWDRQLNVPSEGHKGNPSPQFCWVCPEEKNSCCQWGQNLGPPRSAVQYFNHLATKQPTMHVNNAHCSTPHVASGVSRLEKLAGSHEGPGGCCSTGL